MNQSDKQQPTDQREKDILALCTAVLNMSPHWYNNPNGPDTSTCPLCRESEDYGHMEIADLNHAPDCAYLIAKDLSTGLL